MHEYDYECCICLDNINYDEQHNLICCNNHLHKDCYNLYKQKYIICPICRRELNDNLNVIKLLFILLYIINIVYIILFGIIGIYRKKTLIYYIDVVIIIFLTISLLLKKFCII